jgi:hypothetical protein
MLFRLLLGDAPPDVGPLGVRHVNALDERQRVQDLFLRHLPHVARELGNLGEQVGLLGVRPVTQEFRGVRTERALLACAAAAAEDDAIDIGMSRDIRDRALQVGRLWCVGERRWGHLLEDVRRQEAAQAPDRELLPSVGAEGDVRLERRGVFRLLLCREPLHLVALERGHLDPAFLQGRADGLQHERILFVGNDQQQVLAGLHQAERRAAGDLTHGEPRGRHERIDGCDGAKVFGEARGRVIGSGRRRNFESVRGRGGNGSYHEGPNHSRQISHALLPIQLCVAAGSWPRSPVWPPTLDRRPAGVKRKR